MALQVASRHSVLVLILEYLPKERISTRFLMLSTLLSVWFVQKPKRWQCDP
jgi:hypothetical protein